MYYDERQEFRKSKSHSNLIKLFEAKRFALIMQVKAYPGVFEVFGHFQSSGVDFRPTLVRIVVVG